MTGQRSATLVAALLSAGLVTVERVDSLPNTNIKSDAVLRFPRQAQFHPLKFLNGVAGMILDAGGKIFTGTRVVAVQSVVKGKKTPEREAYFRSHGSAAGVVPRSGSIQLPVRLHHR